ncbi:DUF6090 family protein [Portibacter marinus]|uniref:DUF6090 family protein n=1 Tax=Portibacter marinus TaxID=2898660 RepID=UPI001F18E132|nr:DUF6090 family protein [Portibacter marinus]
MLKFFRKIRFDLIKRHRVNQYLLYAAGEILLVVAGILIALQINNWNDQRKVANTQQDFLLELNEDIDQLFNGYSWRLPDIENNYEISLKGLQYVENCNAVDERKLYLDTVLLTHQVLPAFYSIHDTYDEMLSAKMMSNLPNETLRAQIKDLYHSLEYSNSFIDYFRTELGRANEIIWKKVLFSYDENGKLEVTYTLENLCEDFEFRNALVEVIDARQDYRNDYLMLLGKITKVRNELVKELKLRNG